MVEEPEEFLAPAAVAPVTAGGEERSSDSGMSSRYRISIEMTFGSIVTHSTSRARPARRWTAACTPDAQAHPRAEESPQEEGRGFLGQKHIQSGLSSIDGVVERIT
jgi:hypothetical protein